MTCMYMQVHENTYTQCRAVSKQVPCHGAMVRGTEGLRGTVWEGYISHLKLVNLFCEIQGRLKRID